jgi:uncharacterized protein YfbU (UPF0304 family)
MKLMELTLKERLFLANQFKILEQLIPAESRDYERARKILERGYSFEYHDLFGGFSEEGLSIEQCKEVMDILDVYRMMRYSYRNLPDKTGIDERRLQFLGL